YKQPGSLPPDPRAEPVPCHQAHKIIPVLGLLWQGELENAGGPVDTGRHPAMPQLVYENPRRLRKDILDVENPGFEGTGSLPNPLPVPGGQVRHYQWFAVKIFDKIFPAGPAVHQPPIDMPGIGLARDIPVIAGEGHLIAGGARPFDNVLIV